jgi:ORF6N domain-containing protein
MPEKFQSPVSVEQIDGMIRTIRGVRVMPDRDLAKIYGVPTFRFNEAIKRNRHRFPPDFMFQLTREEFDSLKSQNAMSKPGNSSQFAMSSGKHRGAAYRPYAFTEHGALHAANVLRSKRAVQMNTTCGDAVGWTALSVWETGERLGRARVNVFVIRAFVKMRETLRAAPELARKLTARLDAHEAAIVQVLQEVMQILNPPPIPPPQRPQIGFK